MKLFLTPPTAAGFAWRTTHGIYREGEAGVRMKAPPLTIHAVVRAECVPIGRLSPGLHLRAQTLNLSQGAAAYGFPIASWCREPEEGFSGLNGEEGAHRQRARAARCYPRPGPCSAAGARPETCGPRMVHVCGRHSHHL